MDDMLIRTTSQLVTFCETLRAHPAIFVDTEFVSEGRYYPTLGTIQLGAPGEAAIVDPLALSDLSPLLTLMTDPSIVKVFHAAVQDLAIFYRLIGAPVFPLFDTQIAAALLGYDEQISFANLVERVTGKSLGKGHSFTDWLQRPLTQGQIDYALDDVRYLAPVYEHLVNELTARNRLEWAREEFHRHERDDRFRPADPRELYLRIRGVDRMRGSTLSALRELVAWREETARAKNIPVGHIARDEVLTELARRPRENASELRGIRGLTHQQLERFGAQMVEVAKQGSVAPRPTNQRRQPSLPSSLEPTVDFLTLCLRSLAGQQALCPGVVATRSDLTNLILAGELADVPLMRGWRRKAIGEALLATLQGKATAHIVPGSREVHLEWHTSEG